MIGGDVEPAGICGSGLIDIVAQLRLAGLLDDGGMMMSPRGRRGAGHPLAGRLVIDDEGVRAFALHRRRRAHPARRPCAAVREGRDLDRHRDRDARAAGSPPADLDEVHARRFVRHLHQPARAPGWSGSCPPVAVDRIKAVGNTASEGAKMALMSFREREVACELPAFVEYIELSGVEDFNDRFIGEPGVPAARHRCARRGRRRSSRRRRPRRASTRTTG